MLDALFPDLMSAIHGAALAYFSVAVLIWPVAGYFARRSVAARKAARRG